MPWVLEGEELPKMQLEASAFQPGCLTNEKLGDHENDPVELCTMGCIDQRICVCDLPLMDSKAKLILCAHF